MFENIKNHVPKDIYSDQEKTSAVLIPLILIEDQYHILFEIRSPKLRRQPGEICFPGGRKEEKDKNTFETALRETKEELCMEESNIEMIGPLDYYLGYNHIRVDAYLGILHQYYFTFNEEVEKVFTVPLSFFLEKEPELYINQIQTIPDSNFPFEYIPNGKNYHFSKGKNDTPVYRYNNYFIWGLTARILYHNIKYLKGGI